MKAPIEAMGEAIRYAIAGDCERSRLWLDIARELREGTRPAPNFGSVQKSAEKLYKLPAPDRGHVKLRTSDTQKLEVPAVRPGDAVGGIENCVHCGYTIAPEEPNAFGVVGYVHTRTGISTCPVKIDMATDQTFVQTWAEPPRDWSQR